MAAAPITACLLHADYHVMDRACWDVTMDWFFEHQDLPPAAQRAAYQGAVERRILDGLRTPAAPPPEPTCGCGHAACEICTPIRHDITGPHPRRPVARLTATKEP